jgi:hypothetical protein
MQTTVLTVWCDGLLSMLWQCPTLAVSGLLLVAHRLVNISRVLELAVLEGQENVFSTLLLLVSCQVNLWIITRYPFLVHLCVSCKAS